MKKPYPIPFVRLSEINNQDIVTLVIYVRTRWNLALDMLLSTLKINPASVAFLLHFATADGRKYVQLEAI
jgi:hypothetical protein